MLEKNGVVPLISDCPRTIRDMQHKNKNKIMTIKFK